jgi:hypothetical protein
LEQDPPDFKPLRIYLDSHAIGDNKELCLSMSFIQQVYLWVTLFLDEILNPDGPQLQQGI